MNDTHLKKNSVYLNRIFIDDLLVLAQGGLVVPLAEKVIRLFEV